MYFKGGLLFITLLQLLSKRDCLSSVEAVGTNCDCSLRENASMHNIGQS